MRIGVVIVFLFLLSNTIFGQQVSVFTEKKNMLIGEQFYLFYKIVDFEIDSVDFNPFEKEISCKRLDSKEKESITLEIIDKFSDTLIDLNGAKQWIGKYKVTCWDSGKVEIPSVDVVLNGQQLKFENYQIEVSLSEKIAGKDIYEIKESFFQLPEFLKSWLDFLKKNWWLLLGVTFIASLIVWLVIYLKKKKQALNELTLEEITIQKIDELNSKKLWMKNQLKEHYVELSYILRIYLSQKLTLNLLEKTSEEAILLLSTLSLEETLLDEIQLILEQSDLVKFAKSIPEEFVIIKNSNLTKEIIKRLAEIK